MGNNFITRLLKAKNRGLKRGRLQTKERLIELVVLRHKFSNLIFGKSNTF
jgi:hypothetical protein